MTSQSDDEEENRTYIVPEHIMSQKKLKRNKKIGHFRVDTLTGQTSYKSTPAAVLSRCVQKGITFSVGRLTSTPDRDVLLQDFEVVETILFPSEGSKLTPAHPFDDFTFRTYAPTAFRYFRDLFGILPSSFMLSINQPLRELANPGASGSLFFVTQDDEYIIKTLQKKEANFLQKLLPGYYMNLVQNPRTLLPKFYGLYCVRSRGRNIRVIVMNNLIPSQIEMDLKFDLKGSTYRRRASPQELAKTRPVLKDLDFVDRLPGGLIFDPDIHTAFLKTLKRDCLVLESFKIMDFSLLIAIHHLEKAAKEKRKLPFEKNKAPNVDMDDIQLHLEGSSDDSSSSLPSMNSPQLLRLSPDRTSRKVSITEGVAPESLFNELVITEMKHSRRSAFLSATIMKNKYTTNLDLWSGGIPVQNKQGEKLLIFCGIIDILQCYRLKKKLEHALKSLCVDGTTVSVHNPAFYGKRFLNFVTANVFRKDTSSRKRKPQVPFQKFVPASVTTFQTEKKRERSPPQTLHTVVSSPPRKYPMSQYLHPAYSYDRFAPKPTFNFDPTVLKPESSPSIRVQGVGEIMLYEADKDTDDPAEFYLNKSSEDPKGETDCRSPYSRPVTPKKRPDPTTESTNVVYAEIRRQDDLIWKSPNAVFDPAI